MELEHVTEIFARRPPASNESVAHLSTNQARSRFWRTRLGILFYSVLCSAKAGLLVWRRSIFDSID